MKRKLAEWDAGGGRTEIHIVKNEDDPEPFLLLEAIYEGRSAPRGVVPVRRGNLSVLSNAIETAKDRRPSTKITRELLSTWTAEGRTVSVYLARGPEPVPFPCLVFSSTMPGFPEGTVIVERQRFATVLAAIEKVRAAG